MGSRKIKEEYLSLLPPPLREEYKRNRSFTGSLIRPLVRSLIVILQRQQDEINHLNEIIQGLQCLIPDYGKIKVDVLNDCEEKNLVFKDRKE